MKKGLTLAGLLALAACTGSNNTPEPAPAPAAEPAVEQLRLTVNKTGSGVVQSTPAGIYCDGVCSFQFDRGSRVTLHATPANGWRFSGWGETCAAAATTCDLVLNQDTLATAAFTLLTVTPPPVIPPVPPPKTCVAYGGPPLSTLNAYEGLMHEHSAYSDGDPHSIPADYFRIAGANGYDFAGASEHSDSYDEGNYVTVHASCTETPDGFLTCVNDPSDDKLHKWNATLTQAGAASSSNFLAVRGFEWTSDVFGHINIYFSKNFTNAKTDGGYATTMETFWSWFTRAPDMPGEGGSATSTVPMGGGADGLAHFNHPHDKCQTKNDPSGATADLCDWNDYTLIPDAVERMFGMEVYNDGNRDDKYMPWYTRALDKGWRLAPIGSEDEHFAEYAVEHRPKTVTLASTLTENGFKEAWLARRTYALTPGEHLRVDFDADGHPMGSELICDTGKAVQMRVNLRQKNGDPFPGTLRLFSNGGEEIAQLDQAQGVFEIPVQAGRHWYFVRAHGVNGKSVAYLAPIWIESR